MSEIVKIERGCAVCGSKASAPIYRQAFSGLSTESLLNGYTVAVCRNCGFAFADGLPDQESFDQYYRNMSKYEQQHARSGGDTDLVRCQSTVKALEGFLSSLEAGILDIGCATGRNLKLLKDLGYQNVLGIDPSSTCAQIAADVYGVTVLPHTISSMPEWRERFDAILLVSVIEHIQHLNPLIERIRGMLSTGGVLLIEHPDVLRFSPDVSGPFQEFSTEHVNFFSNLSLANLLRRHGFQELLTFQEDRPSADGIMEPSSLSVFRKTGAILPEPVIPDLQTKPSLQAYIAESQRIDEHICITIDRIVEGGSPVIIWGVGAHTQRLMATSRLKSANIKAFIDSNPRYQGKQLLGFPIISPEELGAFPDPILISSKIWQQDIARQIRAKGNENEIILLYPERSVREHSAN